jgi:hypothetical protein
MPQPQITDQEVAELVERVTVAAKAYIRGDMETYFTLIHHSDDFTLMSPFGGVTVDGFDTSPERLAALKDFFRRGGGRPDLCLRRPGGAGACGTAARQSWRIARAGLVPARDLDIPAHGGWLGAGPPARRRPGASHHHGPTLRTGPRLTRIPRSIPGAGTIKVLVEAGRPVWIAIHHATTGSEPVTIWLYAEHLTLFFWNEPITRHLVTRQPGQIQ